MKKIAMILTVVLLLSCIAGCVTPPAETTEPASTAPQSTGPAPTDTEPAPTEPTQGENIYITGDEVDLRQMAVDYMYAMANIQWTAGQQLDYSKYGAKNLVYESGQTYLGMVYNNNATGLEMFMSILDGNNNHIGTDAGWDTAPGNSCATSIRHAWQQISTTVGFGYSADMMPCYRYSGVVAIGNIDWSVYDRTHTKTVFEGNSRDVILEAYALTLPGDALVRHWGDKGGHALMITKTPIVVRNDDGSINLVDSYLYLTDQNNNLNHKREHPSSWTVDAKVSFSTALQEGYLPVTIAELRDGVTLIPTFALTNAPTADVVAGGTVSGTIESNYCMNTVRVEVRSGDAVVAEAAAYPYDTKFLLSKLDDQLNIAGLPAGQYTLAVIAEVGLGTETLVELTFAK
jgi:hypothetical protein